GGWYFEHHNEFYPDVDDTAMALIALQEVRGQSSKLKVQSSKWNASKSTLNLELGTLNSIAASRLRGVTAASQRALRWMLAMQNRDGGWGAFDKDNDNRFLCRVPFA